MLNRILAPEFKSVDQFDLFQPERVMLSNDLNLFVFNGGDQDLVRIEWIFDNAAFNIEKPLLNLAVCGMLLEGTAQFSAAELSEKVDFYGAFLQPEFSADHSSLALYCLNRHLHQLLPLVKDVLTQAIFPQKELNTYSRNNKQKLQISLKKNDFIARRVFNDALFRGTKYGYAPMPADYDQLIQEELLSLYQANFQPSNCTMFVAGKVTDNLLTSIIRIFGDDWPADKPKPVEKMPVFTESPHVMQVEERPGSLQSAIRLGNRGIGRNHPDFPAFQVVNTLLGGYFGSRLMMNIREDKGYTYGIGSGVGSLKHASFFTIATEVGVDVTAATVAEIEKEINRLRNEVVGGEELTLVKNYMLGSFLGSLENIFSHADKFKNAYFSGLTLTYYENYVAVVKNITPERILETAQVHLNYKNMCKVVVGKM